MNFDGCIVTQTHIPEYDVQGNLRYYDKLELIADSINHLRDYNPNSYIILCGHGVQYPYESTISLCNQVIWETPCYPLKPDGFVENMPAQYKSVFKGIRAAKEAGFKQVLKTRTDCIHGIPNICLWCEEILAEENKSLLITQQTSPDCPKLGDCFMYGSEKLLYNIWNADKPVLDDDGLKHIGLSFYSVCNGLVPFDLDKWNKSIKGLCSFRDVINLEYIDLRRNYFQIKSTDIMRNLVEANEYHWGKKLGWHEFDSNGNMTSNSGNFYSEKTFYS